MDNFKSGFISIVGRPNVGKSTLLNKLAGQKIAIMSDKPQTTRNNIKAIVNGDDYQMIFIDTPGIHKPKHKLGEVIVNAAKSSFNEVDVILFLTEATNNEVGKGDTFILERLKHLDIPVILVLNKIDTVKNKEQIINAIQLYKDFLNFAEIIPISALEDDGTKIILNTLKKYIEYGPKYFPDDMITDQPERNMVAEIIREKGLQMLQDEIPHGLAVEVTKMEKREGKDLINIQATIYCDRDSHKAIIIGKKGSMLKQIGQLARIDIEQTLDSKVFLELWVKPKKDWRNNSSLLKQLEIDI